LGILNGEKFGVVHSSLRAPTNQTPPPRRVRASMSGSAAALTNSRAASSSSGAIARTASGKVSSPRHLRRRRGAAGLAPPSKKLRDTADSTGDVIIVPVDVDPSTPPHSALFGALADGVLALHRASPPRSRCCGALAPSPRIFVVFPERGVTASRRRSPMPTTARPPGPTRCLG
jgi:hypothetical protein